MFSLKWVLSILMSLNGLSETVFIYALPLMILEMGISENLAQQTMSSEFLGFSIGLFLWGNLSDRWGRRPCVIAGLLLYIFGYLGCAFSQNFSILIGFRLLQAFGSSVSSVLFQAIARDTLSEVELSKTYSFAEVFYIFMCLISPFIGMLVTHFGGWRGACWLGVGLGIFVLSLMIHSLPETKHLKKKEKSYSKETAKKILKDRFVFACTLITAILIGLRQMFFLEFSLFCESKWLRSFFLIIIVLFSIAGALWSSRLRVRYDAATTLMFGMKLTFYGALGFAALLFGIANHWPLSVKLLIIAFPSSVMIAGATMTIQNSCSVALVHYEDQIGSATSFFSGSYYLMIALMTLGQSYFHTPGNLKPSVFYYFCLVTVASMVTYITFSKKSKR